MYVLCIHFCMYVFSLNLVVWTCTCWLMLMLFCYVGVVYNRLKNIYGGRVMPCGRWGWRWQSFTCKLTTWLHEWNWKLNYGIFDFTFFSCLVFLIFLLVWLIVPYYISQLNYVAIWFHFFSRVLSFLIVLLVSLFLVIIISTQLCGWKMLWKF